MASIVKLAKGYRARWRTPDGQSRSKTFERRGDAEKFLTKTDYAKLTGDYVDPQAGRVTVKDYAGQWVASQVWRASTTVHIEGVLNNHVYPVFGNRRIASVRPGEVQAFVRKLTDTHAPGTVRNVYGVLAAVYVSAVRDRVMGKSPCLGVKLPVAPRRQVVPLTLEQVEAVAEVIGEHYRPLVVLGAGAGLRIGEALGLDIAQIDFMGRQLSVTQQAVTVRKVTTLGAPKTETSIRTVPLADSVLAELAAYLAPRKDKTGLLVADANGNPIPQNRFSQTWARATVRAGLPKGTRYHDLRHTFASALIANGCSVKAVQAALGHKSAAMTLDIYSHLWPSDEDRTRAAVEAFLRPVSDSCHAPGQEG